MAEKFMVGCGRRGHLVHVRVAPEVKRGVDLAAKETGVSLQMWLESLIGFGVQNGFRARPAMAVVVEGLEPAADVLPIGNFRSGQGA